MYINCYFSEESKGKFCVLFEILSVILLLGSWK